MARGRDQAINRRGKAGQGYRFVCCKRFQEESAGQIVTWIAQETMTCRFECLYLLHHLSQWTTFSPSVANSLFSRLARPRRRRLQLVSDVLQVLTKRSESVRTDVAAQHGLAIRRHGDNQVRKLKAAVLLALADECISFAKYLFYCGSVVAHGRTVPLQPRQRSDGWAGPLWVALLVRPFDDRARVTLG